VVVLSDTLSSEDTATVNLVNSGAATWFVRSCPRQIEQLIANRWTLIAQEVPLRDYGSTTLLPGGTQLLNARVESDLQSGI
jgi:hypothetical protein